MSRDVLTVGSTTRIPFLYRGEYSQWVERFMNYLEEQTDGKAMINSIKNDDQPLPRVTQVSIAGTTSTKQPPLKDKSMWSDQEKRVLSDLEASSSSADEKISETVHMIMPSKDNLYNGRKEFGFENLRYFEKAKDLRPTLYDEKVIGPGYTLMFLTHSDEALEIEKFKRSRENKIEFAYDYGNLNASYVNEKINFEDDYFQKIINLDFEKIDSPFQQTSSLKQYVPNVILEKIIIDLEDEVVENQSENGCHVVEKQYGDMESLKVIAPGMFKLNVSQCVSPISISKSSYDSKNVEIKLKRKRRETRSDFVCNDAMNVTCGSRMNDLLNDNNFFIFDDVNVRISPVSKMLVRKKPRDSMIVRSKSNLNTSLPRTVHKWLPKLQPLAEPVAKWFPRVKHCPDFSLVHRFGMFKAYDGAGEPNLNVVLSKQIKKVGVVKQIQRERESGGERERDEEDESDGEDVRDECCDADLSSNAFSYAHILDSRSCGESVLKGIQGELERYLLNTLVSESVEGNINDKVVDSSKDSGNSKTINKDIAPIPMPVSKNHLLNPSDKTVVSPRILRKGEVFYDGGGNGLSHNDSNNLKLISGRINELQKEVVDLDLIIVNGSKAWFMTLVGYFVGMRMSHKEIVGHLRKKWRTHHLDENLEGLNRIASRIGTPVIMDRITTSMCERAYGGASFAWVLVEANATKGLVDSIEVCYKCLGMSMDLRVEYPWKPIFCTHFNVFGHGFDKCKAWELNEMKKKQRAEVASKRVDTGGSNIGSGEWNENSQCVPMKKTSVIDRAPSKENIQNNKGKSKVDKGMNSIGKSGKGGVTSGQMDIDERNISEKNENKMILIKVVVVKGKMNEHDRIKEMAMNKQLAEVEVFFKTWQVLTIFEMEIWFEEKLNFYKKSIGEEAYENIVNQIGVDCNGDMKDEVANDRCSSVQFITQNVDFRDCVDELRLGDINTTGMYYTWIQKRRNPELGTLKKLDRIMEGLDKDPSNITLREEEMIYFSTYKEATIDEEKLISRSRIEFVYVVEGKAYYGQDVPNLFVSHFKSFLVVWIDKKGSEKDFRVSEVWKVVRNDSLKGFPYATLGEYLKEWSTKLGHKDVPCEYNSYPRSCLVPFSLILDSSRVFILVVLDLTFIYTWYVTTGLGSFKGVLYSFSLTMVFPTEFYMGGFFKEANLLKMLTMVKEKPEKDKIGSKPNKNGKRGEAEKSQKQLQSIEKEKLKKMQVEGPKMSDFYEFTDELIPFISPPEYDCFLFKVKPNSRDFTKDVVEDISPTKEPQVLNTLPTHPTLQLNMKFQPSSEYPFTYVVRIFFPFLVYSVVPHYLLSLRNEDIIFDPGICKSDLSRPDISPRCGTIKTFNTHRSHLNKCSMLIHGMNNPILDVLLFHFYPP
uniref:Uncharacterized protein n=1 Tax=Tanacetum cinerariifolium TaxID=118510 RepID=A0A6L2MCS7_TANCI|nr:hypothetical protein [Tanacetum cinerariifolium]